VSRTVSELLREALLHLDAATAYARRSAEEPQMVLDAMAMRLFAGLETLTRLPDSTVEMLFPGEWPDMRGLRNRIAHGYGAVNLTRVRATVTDELPAAMQAIRLELERFDPLS